MVRRYSEVFLSGYTLVVGGFLGVAISQGQSREITAKLENSLSKTVRKKVASVDVELDPPPVNNRLPPSLLDDARAC
jgi:hypothetical protein